jgi:hypothetical protein
VGASIFFGGVGVPGEYSSQAFPKAVARPESFMVTPLEALCADGTYYTHGTSFFLTKGDRHFLATSWHVLSGLNFFTKEQIGVFRPTKFRFYHRSFEYVDNQLKVWMGSQEFFLSEQGFELYSRPPIWQGSEVDVWLMEIENFQKKLGDHSTSGLALMEQYFDLEKANTEACAVGDDIFVCGYPLKTYEGLLTPIWKRGSLASEPLFEISPKRSFLVDIQSTSGMSGGVVLKKVQQSIDQDSGYPQQLKNPPCELIGIYSGRAVSDENTHLGLGYCWTKDTLIGLINDGAYRTLPATID